MLAALDVARSRPASRVTELSVHEELTTPYAERAARGLPRDVAATLSEGRWRHCLSVAETAYRLAGALGWTERDRERALLAGLLHDVAKERPSAELRALAAEWGAEEEPEFAGLLHAPAAARVAASELGVSDVDVLEAVARHPTGGPAASPLLQLLFVSDHLEPGRPHLRAEERELLARALRGEVGLAQLFCHVLRRKVDWILARGRAVHPRSIEAWNAACAGRMSGEEGK